MKVIRRYFYFSGIDPVFTMMDEIERSNYYKKRYGRALEEELLEHPEYEEVFSTAFSNDRSDDIYYEYCLPSIPIFSVRKRDLKTWLSI